MTPPIRKTVAIRKTVTVPLRPLEAFRLFAEGLDEWWPRDDRSRPGARLRLRNGRVEEEPPADAAARPAPWATVTIWEPGRRLVLAWHRGHGVDEEPSEVCVTFTPSDLGTRVDLTHAAGAGVARWTAALASFAECLAVA